MSGGVSPTNNGGVSPIDSGGASLYGAPGSSRPGSPHRRSASTGGAPLTGGTGPSVGSPPATSGPSSAAYREALGFEQILLGQLTQQLTSTVSDAADGSSGDGLGGSSDGSSGGSSDPTSGLMGGDPSSSAYSSLIPQTLTTALMSAAGNGLTQALAAELGPPGGARP